MPVTPAIARYLRDEHGIEVFVQPSPIRVFTEDEFEAHGATVQEDLAECPIVFAVKEIPSSFFRPGGAYMFFSHVIKGQPYNMPMLRRLMELGCTLIDYEKVIDDQGRRLIFFGRHAGLAGMIETLHALGQAAALGRHPQPLRDRSATRTSTTTWPRPRKPWRRRARKSGGDGLPAQAAPLTIGVTGYGNVARGAWEILNLLPVEVIEPSALSDVVDGPGRVALRGLRHDLQGAAHRRAARRRIRLPEVLRVPRQLPPHLREIAALPLGASSTASTGIRATRGW